MKVIIAGSRSLALAPSPTLYLEFIENIHTKYLPITEVVSGGARGGDLIGEDWATIHGVPIKRFLPDWSAGKGAGFVRNMQMGDYAEGLIALWDSKSRGTKQMVGYAIRKKLMVAIGYFSQTSLTACSYYDKGDWKWTWELKRSNAVFPQI